MEITLDHVEMISITNGTGSHFPNSQGSHLKLNDIRLPHSYEAFNPKLQKLKESKLIFKHSDDKDLLDC